MSRKDYIKIADVFLSGRRALSRLNMDPELLDLITQEYVLRMVDVLMKDNPSFDPKRFRAACWEK